MTRPGLTTRVQSLEEREENVPAGTLSPLQEDNEVQYPIMPQLTRECLCLVGNGPSSKELGRYIDMCENVARIHGFPMGEAGNKWDIWTGAFGSAAIKNVTTFKNHLGVYPRIMWMVGANTFNADRLGLTKDRFVSTLNPKHIERIKQFCPNPTAGFLAIEAALRSSPADLVLVGFDGSKIDEPGWKHWDTEKPWDFWPERADPSIAHDMHLEKQLIMHWFKTREFCGHRFSETNPHWWRMSEVEQPGRLAGKKVCLVGNGPSAVENAELIDSEFDVVVRCNAFCIGEAGHKWDAWYSAHAGLGAEHAVKTGMYEHPSVPSWGWMLRTSTPSVPFRPKQISYLETCRVKNIARKFDMASSVQKGIHPVTGKKRPIQPTSGMFAMDLALSMQPKELTIVGFDAVTQEQPGWEHYGSNPAPWWPERPSVSGGKHDYVQEKERIQKWLETREFFGVPYPMTKPRWIRMKGTR